MAEAASSQTPAAWPRRAARARAAIVALAAVAIGGCGPPRALTPAQRGAVVYRTNCASCHNPDPNLPGAIGPAIAGAPRALIAARVMRAAYPPGYHPQRQTHLMRPLPWLEPHLDDLAAYLDSAAARR